MSDTALADAPPLDIFPHEPAPDTPATTSPWPDFGPGVDPDPADPKRLLVLSKLTPAQITALETANPSLPDALDKLPWQQLMDVLASAGIGVCEHEQCSGTFNKRAKSGGKPQRFCKPECRTAFHAQRPQRAPTCSASIAPEASEQPPEDDDSTWVYLIPHQLAIEVHGVKGGGVEIHQEGEHGPDEAQRIDVAAGNVVALALRILYAAGFKAVGMYAVVNGGNEDIEEGAIAKNFDWR